jgi:hypothetical protein
MYRVVYYAIYEGYLSVPKGVILILWFGILN